MLSQKQRLTYHTTTCLCPVFVSWLLACYVSWQPAPFLLSLPLSAALEPNYPQRTQRSYHKARSYSNVHLFTIQACKNSQHTCHRLRRGIDEVVTNPPLIRRQVGIRPPFGFQSCLLEGYFTNRVSYLLYWSLVAFCLFAEFHSPLEQMGVCYLCTVENTTLQTFTQLFYSIHFCSVSHHFSDSSLTWGQQENGKGLR